MFRCYLLLAPSSITSAICPNVMNGKKHVMRADLTTHQRQQKSHVIFYCGAKKKTFITKTNELKSKTKCLGLIFFFETSNHFLRRSRNQKVLKSILMVGCWWLRSLVLQLVDLVFQSVRVQVVHETPDFGLVDPFVN